MTQLQLSRHLTTAEMREGIAAAEGLPDSLDAEMRAALADRVSSALQWRRLQDHARATDLIQANQNLLWDTRILTDIRPIFTEGSDPKPTGWLALHTLQLTYWDGSHVGEFFVVLDRDELHRLAKGIERAQSKDRETTAMMLETGLPRVSTDVGVENDD